MSSRSPFQQSASYKHFSPPKFMNHEYEYAGFLDDAEIDDAISRQEWKSFFGSPKGTRDLLRRKQTGPRFCSEESGSFIDKYVQHRGVAGNSSSQSVSSASSHTSYLEHTSSPTSAASSEPTSVFETPTGFALSCLDLDILPDPITWNENESSDKYKLVVPEDPSTIDWEESELGPGYEVNLISDQPKTMPDNDEDNHLAPLDQDQVKRLEQRMLQTYDIDGLGFPKLSVSAADIICRLKVKILNKLSDCELESIRIVGGVASHVMCESFPYNDLDISLYLKYDFQHRISIFERLKALLCEVLYDLCLLQAPDKVEEMKGESTYGRTLLSLPRAYFSKSIMVPPAAHETDPNVDSWSLVCLKNHLGKNLEFKFCRCGKSSSYKRHFEFSSDSFQILLNTVYLDYLQKRSNDSIPTSSNDSIHSSSNLSSKNSADDGDKNSELPTMTFGFEFEKYKSELTEVVDVPYLGSNKIEKKCLVFPQIYCVCLFPDFVEAVHHINNRIIKIYNPEELRGGGLLKYAYLRQKGFVDDPEQTAASIQCAKNAMVIKFLILVEQNTSCVTKKSWKILSKYLKSHYPLAPRDRIDYLSILSKCLLRSHVSGLASTKHIVAVIKEIVENAKAELKEKEAEAYYYKSDLSPQFQYHHVSSSLKPHYAMKEVCGEAACDVLELYNNDDQSDAGLSTATHHSDLSLEDSLSGKTRKILYLSGPHFEGTLHAPTIPYQDNIISTPAFSRDPDATPQFDSPSLTSQSTESLPELLELALEEIKKQEKRDLLHPKKSNKLQYQPSPSSHPYINQRNSNRGISTPDSSITSSPSLSSSSHTFSQSNTLQQNDIVYNLHTFDKDTPPYVDNYRHHLLETSNHSSTFRHHYPHYALPPPSHAINRHSLSKYGYHYSHPFSNQFSTHHHQRDFYRSSLPYHDLMKDYHPSSLQHQRNSYPHIYHSSPASSSSHLAINHLHYDEWPTNTYQHHESYRPTNRTEHSIVQNKSHRKKRINQLSRKNSSQIPRRRRRQPVSSRSSRSRRSSGVVPPKKHNTYRILSSHGPKPEDKNHHDFKGNEKNVKVLRRGCVHNFETDKNQDDSYNEFEENKKNENSFSRVNRVSYSENHSMQQKMNCDMLFDNLTLI